MKVKALKAVLSSLEEDMEIIVIPEGGYNHVIELVGCSKLVDCIKTRSKGKAGDMGEFDGGEPLLYLGLQLKRDFNRMHCVPREVGK